MNILRRASRAATAMWTVAALIAASAAAACRTESPPPSAPLSTPPAATARPEVPSQSTTSGTPFTPPPAAYNGVLPSLPSSSFPPARPPDVVQAVYTFAARHPEVLHYVPCFCGCQHSGHRDNDDCFISGREADGKPRWEPHGMTWAVCIDVARDAMQMHASGAGVAQIRSAIEAKYRSSFSSMTPTSPPPERK